MKIEKVQPPDSSARRSFVGAVIGMIASSIATVLGVTVSRYAVGPALSATDKSQWTDVGLLEEIPEGKPIKRSVVVSQNAGWGRFNSQQLVWVVRKERKITVFSAVCPHLGCTINAATNGFICPCHGSAWNAEGQKLGGPTPREMDILEHRLQGDLLRVNYQHFRQGVERKEPLACHESKLDASHTDW